MNYLEITFYCADDFSEILMAELAEIGFETFVEEPERLIAYIIENQFVEVDLDALLLKYYPIFNFSFSKKIIEKQNWNEEWEKNYEPIRVDNRVMVRASFHLPEPDIKYDIIINPKMSFGTGHHETTSMMMSQQLKFDFTNKSVLDIGCGTGILAILANKLGASELSAFDIEEWAAENSKENVIINQCSNIAIRQGTIENEPPKAYDIILANINRNILLRDINQYINYLKPNGTIIVSGFYITDQADIELKFLEYGLVKISELNNNNWSCVSFYLY